MSFYSLKQIETPRLILRPLKMSDLDGFYALMMANIEQLRQWFPWAKTTNYQQAQRYLEHVVKCWCGEHEVVQFGIAIILKEQQRLIGAGGFNRFSDHEQKIYNMGYWCDQQFQGQGYITEMANALTRFALDGAGANTVQISMNTNNHKSRAVPLRLNFEFIRIGERGPDYRITNSPEFDYVYELDATSKLPPLEVVWDHDFHPA